MAPLVLLLTACGNEQISVYNVPKEKPAAPAAAAPDIHWDAPSRWRAQAAGGMRAAGFIVPGKAGDADLSVVVLAGDGGGALANVNRWRTQLGLKDWSEKDLAARSRRLETPLGRALWVEFENAGRGLAAAILPRGGKTWFFKLAGPAKTTAAARPEFETFLKSLHAGH
jgi:hypothetical protein